MSDGTAPQTFDFSRPKQLADDVQQRLEGWANALATQMTHRWADQVGGPLAWQPAGLKTAVPAEFLEQLPPTTQWFELRLDGEHTTWIALPPLTLQLLVTAALGEMPDELPDERSLTIVEMSLVDWYVTELSAVIQASQPCDPPMSCQDATRQDADQLARKFADAEPVVVVGFNVAGPFGEVPLYWLLTQDTVFALMARCSDARAAGSSDDPKPFEPLAKKIPMPVVVRLGSATVHVSDLLALRPGDIIVLDQRVHEPLSVEVAGVAKYTAWPGRVGKRQAVRLHRTVESSD